MPVRVIAGEAKGRTLKGPSRKAVRPTSDRVREALFEILVSHEVDMTNVLDLYSGTGALGIEALSRGAGHCDFVEADARACDVIRENLARTAFLHRAHVYPLPVARALTRLRGPYDLVVADPPYEYDRAEREIGELVEAELVAQAGAIAVEHSKHHEWPDNLGKKRKTLSRRYGDTVLALYQ